MTLGGLSNTGDFFCFVGMAWLVSLQKKKTNVSVSILKEFIDSCVPMVDSFCSFFHFSISQDV